MTAKMNKNINEQEETGVDAAVARGQGQVPADKFEEFKNTMAKLYQVTTAVGTAGAAPTQAAGQAQPPKRAGEPKATGATSPTQKRGSTPGAGGQPLQQQLSQSVSQPTAVQGFVELKRDASDAALSHIARQLGVEEDRLKKLAIDADVRLLINPDLLRVR